MPKRHRRRALGWILLVLVLLALPGALAAPYEGPGQEGVVPVGEGGHTIAVLGGRLDDRTFIALDGLPENACRVVLDGNGTYADARVRFTEGETVAYIWAAPGAVDIPFRVHALWHTDLHGTCTVEETADQTHWHDPSGRPYVDLRLVRDRPIHGVESGGDPVEVVFEVRNNGTIPDNVSAEVTGVNEAFRVAPMRAPTQEVGPEATASFTFAVTVPSEARARMHAMQITFRSDSAWSQGGTAFLDVRAGGDSAGEGPTDPAGASPLPPPTVAPETAPGPGTLLVLALIGVGLWCVRRAHETRY